MLSINPDRVDLEGTNDTAADAYVLAAISDISKAYGGTIDTTGDVDWYKFTLEDDGAASDIFSLLRTNGDSANIIFALFDADGNEIVDANGDRIEDGDGNYLYTGNTLDEAYVKLSLNGLAKGDYTVRITADEPTYYELYPNIGEKGYTLKDLSGKSASGISLSNLRVRQGSTCCG